MQVTHCRSLFLVVCAVFALTAAGQDAVERPSPSASPTPAATENGTAEAERVIVTGSNIPTAQEVGPNPVDVLNRDTIDKAGERTTEQLVRNLTVAGPNGVPTSNNGGAATAGASSISLRGFDASSTLVLIDGFRVAPYPVGTDTGAVTFVDLNSIPRAAIDSIEILKDGASSIYGADAVAGVVNFKLRHDYRGAEVDVEYGNTLDKDSGEFASSIIFGTGDGNTDITGVINYYHRNSIFNRDRGYSNKTLTPSTAASPANLQLSRTSVLASLNLPPDPITNLNPVDYPQYYTTTQPTPTESSHSFLNTAGLALIGGKEGTKLAQIPGTDAAGNFLIPNTQPVLSDNGKTLGVDVGPQTFFGHAPFFTNGNAPASVYTYTQGRSVLFNFNPYSTTLPDSERYGGFVNFDHKICGDQLLVYGDVFYQNVKTSYDLAPTSSGIFQTPGNITLAIPPHAPGQTLGGPTYKDTGVPMGAFNPFNPFQQIISGGTRARLVEFGNRVINNETNAFFSTLGVKGDKLFDGNWGYDASFRYSQIQNISTNTLVSGSRFDRILNAADPIFDPTAPQFIGTTIPYNPFGDYRVPIPSNAKSVAFATAHQKEIDLSKLGTVDLNIYTTSLFTLPAGGVGLAFGGQFRRESLRQEPDDLLLAGDILGSIQGYFTDAGRKAYAFYAEAAVPVFGGDLTAPGLHALELTAAARFEDFRDNNTNVLVPKVGIRWQPFDGSLTLRATWGEGFHQPSLIELFGSPVQNLNRDETVSDSVTKQPIGEVPVIIRSNPNLQPEDSRSFTAGIVYTPKFLPGLTLTVDFYDIESTGRAIIPDLQNVIDRSVAGESLPGEKVTRVNGEIASIELAFQNAGSQKARGVDFGISYQVGTPFGILTWLTQATYLDSFQFAELPGVPEVELRSQAFGPNAEAHLKWRTNSQIDWAWKGFDLGLTAHYLDGFHEILGKTGPNSILEHYVKQTWFFDVRASYRFLVPSAPPAVAGYAKDTSSSGKECQPEGNATLQMANCTWQRLLNDTTITLGCNNVFGHDPPDAATPTNYADFLYDSTGRFVYLSLTKRF